MSKQMPFHVFFLDYSLQFPRDCLYSWNQAFAKLELLGIAHDFDLRALKLEQTLDLYRTKPTQHVQFSIAPLLAHGPSRL